MKLLIGWKDFQLDPTPMIVCGFGSAHNMATCLNYSILIWGPKSHNSHVSQKSIFSAWPLIQYIIQLLGCISWDHVSHEFPLNPGSPFMGSPHILCIVNFLTINFKLLEFFNHNLGMMIWWFGLVVYICV